MYSIERSDKSKQIRNTVYTLYPNLDRDLQPKKNDFVKVGEVDEPNTEVDEHIEATSSSSKPRKRQRTTKPIKKRISRQEQDIKIAKWRQDLKQMFPITNFQLSSKQMALFAHESKSHSDHAWACTVVSTYAP